MCTHPDIFYVVSLVSRYQSYIIKDHRKAVKWIFRYLQRTVDHILCYSGSDLFIKGYTNTDWAGDWDHRKSTSNFSFLLNGGTISWKSKKKTCITLSTMKSEFVACVCALLKDIWSKRFLECLNIAKNSKGPIILYYASQATITYKGS